MNWKAIPPAHCGSLRLRRPFGLHFSKGWPVRFAFWCRKNKFFGFYQFQIVLFGYGLYGESYMRKYRVKET